MPSLDPFFTDRVASLSGETASKISAGLEARAADPEQVDLRTSLLSEALSGLSNATVLEVGCGTGPLCRHLASMTDVGRVIGTEPSPALLRTARDLGGGGDDDDDGGGGKIEWIECYGSDVPVPDASVDLVVVWTVLSHVPRDGHAPCLREARRVLKTGGRILLFDNDYSSWTVGTAKDDRLQDVLERLKSLNENLYVVREFPRLLVDAGFELRDDKLRIHPVVQDAESSYGYQFISTRACYFLCEAGKMTSEESEEVKREARRRVDDGAFIFLLTYGSLIGIKATA